MKPSISKYSVFIFLRQPTFKDFVARCILFDREKCDHHIGNPHHIPRNPTMRDSLSK